jgi:hypothetical protein
MAELSERPNIEIAVIPLNAEISNAPLNTFVIYDNRLVLVEVFSGEISLTDPKDIAHHVDLFEFFYRHALTGDRARSVLLSARDDFM